MTKTKKPKNSTRVTKPEAATPSQSPASPRRRGRQSKPLNLTTFSGRVGGLIRSRRQDLGLTVKQVSDRTGGIVNASSIAGYEAGTDPGFSNLVALCAALELQPSDLVPADAARLIQAGPLDPQAARSILT